jgi:hypothetical protein
MIGTLTQAYTKLTWAGNTLHAYDAGGPMPENVAQGVSVSLNKESSAPTCTFGITPNPAGFELFQKLKASALDKPIQITFGYLNGTEMPLMEYRFAGVQLTTGHDPKLEIRGTSIVKGAWTDNKVSFTMEKEMPLSAYPEFLKEKCGDGCKKLNFKFVGKALEAAPKIMVKGGQMGRTPMNILTDVLRPHGMQIQSGDSAVNGTMVISYVPGYEGELEVDKPTVNTSGTPCGPGQRCVYIIGPGLMTNITRKQDFSTGSSTTQTASSADSPNVPQTSNKSVAQPQNAAPQVSTSASSNLAGGTTGQANPGSSNTGSTAAGKEGQEASAARAKLFTSTINFQVLMVPYMVGIKPRDVIAIPSLSGPGDYIEDWEVDTVQYKQDDVGGVTISITGKRPYTGEEAILDAGSLSAVQGTVAGLITPAAWNRMYWIQGSDTSVKPLSS